jgi:hypothetical protein
VETGVEWSGGRITDRSHGGVAAAMTEHMNSLPIPWSRGRVFDLYKKYLILNIFYENDGNLQINNNDFFLWK